MKHPIAIAIHGGAGGVSRKNLNKQQERAYNQAMQQALDAGYAVLQIGGSSIEATVAAVTVMEDEPLFNAGKGSVFTHEGRNEMDAAIMNGANLQCGAVACVTTIKNPIEAARRVMENSPFVLLSTEGAEEFAREQGLAITKPKYFYTEHRWQQLEKMRSSNAMALDHDAKDVSKYEKFGTVGCVAVDSHGNLAAATSTGGTINKRYRRIGDTPIIGAGTYANHLCAVSCTGRGEDFIRLLAAREIAVLMQYRDYSVLKAANDVIMRKLTKIGGQGGCIAIDKQGNIAMPFNTSGMFRGMIDKKGVKKTGIYDNLQAAII